MGLLPFRFAAVAVAADDVDAGGGGVDGGGVLGRHCSAHLSVSFKASWNARGVLRTWGINIRWDNRVRTVERVY